MPICLTNKLDEKVFVCIHRGFASAAQSREAIFRALLTNTHAIVGDAGYGREIRLGRDLSALDEPKDCWAQRSINNAHLVRSVWPECVAFDKPEPSRICQSQNGRIRQPEADGFSSSIAGGNTRRENQNRRSLR
jgi:hypothetical protein